MEGEPKGRVVFCAENLNFNIKKCFQINKKKKERESYMKTLRAGGNFAL